MDYLYEVREGETIVATGQLTVEHELQPGAEIPFGEHVATVLDVAVSLAGPPRLVLELR